MSILTWVIVVLALLILFGMALYVLTRYVPLIEKNAFDVPRFQMPIDYDTPVSTLGTRNIQIPYDTRSAIDAQYIEAPEDKSKKKLVVFCHETGAAA